MRKAFTLIELLVMLGMIAVLAALAVLSVFGGSDAAKMRGAVRDVFATYGYFVIDSETAIDGARHPEAVHNHLYDEDDRRFLPVFRHDNFRQDRFRLVRDAGAQP